MLASVDRPPVTEKMKYKESAIVYNWVLCLTNSHLQDINRRHRTADRASRASVELYTLIYFKDKVVTATAYITRIMNNGFGCLVPR